MKTLEEVETIFHETFDKAKNSPIAEVRRDEDRTDVSYSVTLYPASMEICDKVCVSASQIFSLISELDVNPGRFFIYPSTVGYDEYLYFYFAYEKD